MCKKIKIMSKYGRHMKILKKLFLAYCKKSRKIEMAKGTGIGNTRSIGSIKLLEIKKTNIFDWRATS